MDSQTEFNNLINESLNNNYNIDNLCLISREYLIQEQTVELPFCKHKFNYIPFYKELVNQKIEYSNRYKLKKCEIMCPYCRHVYNGLIPYLPLENVQLKTGINIPKYLQIDFNNCTYIYKNKKQCNNNCIGSYCYKHINIDNNITKCKYIFKKGIKKGTICNKNIRNNKNDELCSLHKK